MKAYVRLSSSTVTMGVPFALAEVASESLWQSSTLAPREQDQATSDSEVSALQGKLPAVCSSSCVALEKLPGLTSRQSWSSPVCGVRKRRVDLPMEDASSVMANVVLSLNYCA